MTTATLWTPPPSWLAPALQRRPKAMPSDVNTGAWLALTSIERRLDAARAAILTEVGSIRRDPDLVEARKPARIAARAREIWAKAITAEYTAVGNIDATRRQARASIKAKLEERDRVRPVQRQARLDRIADLLLGLADSKREMVLLQALQGGDLDILEAVTNHPAALEAVGVKVSGSTSATNRATIAERFARVLLPEDHARADELEAIASTAATGLSFTNWKLSQELGVQVAELDKFTTARDLAGAWARDGLDTFQMREPYHRAQTAHQNRGEDGDAAIERAASIFTPIDEVETARLESEASKLQVTEVTT